MKRGYIVIRMYCGRCKEVQPFNHIARFPTVQPRITRRRADKTTITFISPKVTPNIPENALCVYGVCMVCDHGGMHVTTIEHWEECHYSVDLLCSCGLPHAHKGKHLEELRRAKAA